MLNNQINTDIIIIGGGMVGLACAAALAESGLNISIIEKTPLEIFQADDPYDLRVSAINPATVNFFIELGLWPALQAQRITPYQDMHVWVDRSELHFSAAEVNQSELGFIVENRIMRKVLWDHLSQHANIKIYCADSLATITFDDRVTATLQNGIVIESSLIIAADGHHSWLKHTLKPAETIRDYNHQALIAHIHTEQPHAYTAWQHFLPEGPLAILPLQDPHHASIVWSGPPGLIQQLLNCNSDLFNTQLTTAFEHRLGELKLLGKRASFPLIMQNLESYIDDRIAYIGDAAHRIHPMAGQGLNLGYQDAQCLAKTIINSLAKKQDFWTRRALLPFQRERKYHNRNMIKAIDGIKWIFASPPSTVQTLRNISLDFLNTKKQIKALIIKKASSQ